MKQITTVLVCSIFLLTSCGKPQKGDPGPAGATGATGASGAEGATGVTGPSAGQTSVVESSIFCTGTLPTTSLQFTYTAVVLKTGDVFATGGVYGASFQIGASSFYAKTQVGAATASVLFTYDADTTASFGFWTLAVNRSTKVASIHYHDSSQAMVDQDWTMTPDKCVVNIY